MVLLAAAVGAEMKVFVLVLSLLEGVRLAALLARCRLFLQFKWVGVLVWIAFRFAHRKRQGEIIGSARILRAWVTGVCPSCCVFAHSPPRPVPFCPTFLDPLSTVHLLPTVDVLLPTNKTAAVVIYPEVFWRGGGWFLQPVKKNQLLRCRCRCRHVTQRNAQR